MRDKCRLSVFENRALRRIFEPKRGEVTGEWRRLHNEELYALYSSPNIIWVRIMKKGMSRVCSMYEAEDRHTQSLVGKTEGSRPLGRTKRYVK